MARISKFSQKEIVRLIRTAKRAFKHPGLDILLAPMAQEFGRILVITPRKIGIAAKRNKVRRRLKAIFYEEQLFEAGFDCIIFVKHLGLNMPFELLKKLLVETIRRFEIAKQTDEKRDTAQTEKQTTVD